MLNSHHSRLLWITALSWAIVPPMGQVGAQDKADEAAANAKAVAEADDTPDAETPAASIDSDPDEWQPPPKRMGEPKGAKRLSPKDAVWIHRARGVVLVDGRVSLREGLLEMFACPQGTKEHESIVAVESKAFVIHAALLNVGAEPGKPVQFYPEYRPATGTTVEIQVLWVDEMGKRHSSRAQDWVRELQTGKPLRHPWVFAGSGFWTDKETGRRHYQAEAGDLICLSNFSTAMLDLPIESSQSNDGLAFEAFAKHIPPLGTHVRLVLMPKVEKPKAEKKPAAPTPDRAEKNGDATSW